MTAHLFYVRMARTSDNRNLVIFEPTCDETREWIRSRTLHVREHVGAGGAVRVSCETIPRAVLESCINSGKFKPEPTDCYATLLAGVLINLSSNYRIQVVGAPGVLRCSAGTVGLRYRPGGNQDHRFYLADGDTNV